MGFAMRGSLLQRDPKIERRMPMKAAKIRYRLLAAAAAVTAALGILMGTTFAWQSISQEALNEASDVVNPGGRLHDDFDGKNKDVYVENFAEEPIYARIRLTEYFEVGRGAGANLEAEGRSGFEVVTSGAVYGDRDSYPVHYFHKDNLTSPYWLWHTGGSTVYMPTFNKNKDSILADINGTLEGLDGKVTASVTDDRYSDYVTYAAGDRRTATEVYDTDANSLDEGADATENVNIALVTATHTARNTGSGSLISMDAWLARLDAGEDTGGFWVYDEDGWVYWSEPVQPGTATGLLLDGIELAQVMDDSWFYVINVTAQFITADDIGISDSTGFYDPEQGTAPTAQALRLLSAIGVQVE